MGGKRTSVTGPSVLSLEKAARDNTTSGRRGGGAASLAALYRVAYKAALLDMSNVGGRVGASSEEEEEEEEEDVGSLSPLSLPSVAATRSPKKKRAPTTTAIGGGSAVVLLLHLLPLEQ